MRLFLQLVTADMIQPFIMAMDFHHHPQRMLQCALLSVANEAFQEFKNDVRLEVRNRASGRENITQKLASIMALSKSNITILFRYLLQRSPLHAFVLFSKETPYFIVRRAGAGILTMFQFQQVLRTKYLIEAITPKGSLHYVNISSFAIRQYNTRYIKSSVRIERPSCYV